MAATDLQLGEDLHKGQQGSVRRGRWNGTDVAVKVARLGTSADLERVRKEVQLMAGLGAHNNVVPLLAARVLPPGGNRAVHSHSFTCPLSQNRERIHLLISCQQHPSGNSSLCTAIIIRMTHWG